MIYISKPQHVEAVQWTGDNAQELYAECGDKITFQHRSDFEYVCNLLAGKDGAQQWVFVPVGHWVVHPLGDFSDMWPVDDDYFQAKYDLDDVDA